MGHMYLEINCNDGEDSCTRENSTWQVGAAAGPLPYVMALKVKSLCRDVKGALYIVIR